MNNNYILQEHLNKAFKTYSENIAIEKSDQKITYKNLNITTNKIANYFRQNNIAKGSHVAGQYAVGTENENEHHRVGRKQHHEYSFSQCIGNVSF